MDIVKFTECSKGRCIGRHHDVKFVPDSAIWANKSAINQRDYVWVIQVEELTGHFLPLSISFSVQQHWWKDVPFAVTKFRVAWSTADRSFFSETDGTWRGKKE